MTRSELNFHRELNAANELIEVNGALVEHDGGFKSISAAKMEHIVGFMDYYQGLIFVGYVNGWI